MATKSNIPSAMAASKDGEEEDIGALIYRESQFRKAEAAAIAASSATSRKNKTSTALHHKLDELQLGKDLLL
eukprot:scaffold5759_cov93-Skeletonema_marinoi.AAC.4